MNFTDLPNNVQVKKAYVGATINTNTDTVSTTVIDAQGFASVMFVALTATVTDGTYVLKIMECDNADGTTGATEVAASAYTKQETIVATDDNAARKVGAVLSKRYCTLKFTSAGTTTGAVIGACAAILGGARNNPVV